ncbi:hypothetical protein BMS3Abin09_00478 [bacterium BMS3Abin09]|nr:hypothetical protein BMS3Abin09_00478 [bacterium BMS3Abin09]GBE41212.1 hypothetical protein BMS3Bbin09_01103 [bacterium BMS3Bbin09]HDH33885.1 hypothetical protein [Nitrospirota bacterium]
MKKINCWEIKKCCREKGGDRTDDLGVCPAASYNSSNGINNGKYAGRICWAIAGTFCGGKVQGDFAQKTVSCMTCEVFKRVKEEEGIENFTLLIAGKPYQPSSK